MTTKKHHREPEKPEKKREIGSQQAGVEKELREAEERRAPRDALHGRVSPFSPADHPLEQPMGGGPLRRRHV